MLKVLRRCIQISKVEEDKITATLRTYRTEWHQTSLVSPARKCNSWNCFVRV